MSFISTAPQTAVDYGVGVIKNVMTYPWKEAIRNRKMPRLSNFSPTRHYISGITENNKGARSFSKLVSADDFNKAWAEEENTGTLSPQWDSKLDATYSYSNNSQQRQASQPQQRPVAQAVNNTANQGVPQNNMNQPANS